MEWNAYPFPGVRTPSGRLCSLLTSCKIRLMAETRIQIQLLKAMAGQIKGICESTAERNNEWTRIVQTWLNQHLVYGLIENIYIHVSGCRHDQSITQDVHILVVTAYWLFEPKLRLNYQYAFFLCNYGNARQKVFVAFSLFCWQNAIQRKPKSRKITILNSVIDWSLIQWSEQLVVSPPT